MLVTYRNAHCPDCGGFHDLCMEESTGAMTYRMHQFVCPKTGRPVPWRPDVFAHVVQKFPAGAVSLVSIPQAEVHQ
jgi:hypothetical protein